MTESPPGSSMVKESSPVLAAKRVLCFYLDHEMTHAEAVADDVEPSRCFVYQSLNGNL